STGRTRASSRWMMPQPPMRRTQPSYSTSWRIAGAARLPRRRKVAMNNDPPILPGCTVLPPMLTPAQQQRKAERAEGKATKPGKGKSKTRDRFAVLNGFVDAGMAGLTRAELAAWLVLYRDTRNGTASTSIADIARRAG